MGKKIRKAMAVQDAKYKLGGLIELDDTFDQIQVKCYREWGKVVHPTKAYLASCRAMILSLKNSVSL